MALYDCDVTRTWRLGICSSTKTYHMHKWNRPSSKFLSSFRPKSKNKSKSKTCIFRLDRCRQQTKLNNKCSKYALVNENPMIHRLEEFIPRLVFEVRRSLKNSWLSEAGPGRCNAIKSSPTTPGPRSRLQNSHNLLATSDHKYMYGIDIPTRNYKASSTDTNPYNVQTLKLEESTQEITPRIFTTPWNQKNK